MSESPKELPIKDEMMSGSFCQILEGRRIDIVVTFTISSVCVAVVLPMLFQCITLLRWLEERYDSVYALQPNFQSNAPPLLQLEPPAPQDLPDTLRGEQWAFVQLPLSGEVH